MNIKRWYRRSSPIDLWLYGVLFIFLLVISAMLVGVMVGAWEGIKAESYCYERGYSRSRIVDDHLICFEKIETNKYDWPPQEESNQWNQK